jgi:hypothetical protein
MRALLVTAGIWKFSASPQAFDASRHILGNTSPLDKQSSRRAGGIDVA